MLFGSISYLNLLPFQLFLKRHIRDQSSKMSLHYNRAVPSQINKALSRRAIDAGFISSIHSPKYACTSLGIIAYKKVHSVLVIEGEMAFDPASASSNQLAKILNLKGRVLIGDEALKYHLDGGEAIDLAEVWYEKTGLPFVFARLCFNKQSQTIQKLAKAFAKTKVKIPQYILKKEAEKRGITASQLKWYLGYISYEMTPKAKKALKLFLKKSKS